MKIVLVAFNVEEENSVMYRKCGTYEAAVQAFDEMIHDVRVQVISTRILDENTAREARRKQLTRYFRE